MKRILILLALAITLMGCSKDIKTDEVKVSEKKVDVTKIEEPFIASYAQKITDFRPYTYLHSEGKAILQNLHEGLFKVKENGELVPGIANGITITEEDGYLVYRIVLRDGVKFHNGKELTPEDIQYSIFRYTGLISGMDTDNMENSKYWKNMINGMASDGFKKGKIEISGSSEILIYIDDFYGKEVTSSIIADTFIVPEGYSENEQSKFPVGLGPYMFEEIGNDGKIKLTRFEEYYGKKPEIKNVEILNIPSKEDRIEMFTSDSLHLIDSYPVLDGEEDLENFSTDIYSLVFNVNDSLFGNVEFREALYSGVDKDKIKTDVLGYSGAAVETPLSPYFSYKLENIEIQKSYNPNRSREIISNNPEFKDEFLSIAYVEEDFLSKAIGEFVRYDLLTLGLQVELLPLPYEEFQKFILEDKAFGMAIIRYTGNHDSYRIMNRFTTRTKLNISDFYQLDYNKFLVEDRENYKGMFDMIKKDFPELYLVDPGTSFKINEKYTGPTYYPYPYLDFSSIKYK